MCEKLILIWSDSSKMEQLFSSLCMCTGIILSQSKLEEINSQLFDIFNIEKNPINKMGFIYFIQKYPIKSNIIRLGVYSVPSKKKLISEFEKDFKEAPPELSKKIETLRKKVIANVKKFREYKRSEEEGIVHFSLRCEPKNKKRPVNFTKKIQLNASIKKFLQILSIKQSKLVVVNGCVTFVFSRKKHKLIGGFSLPTKIPLSKDVVKRLGEADVTGLQLSFEDSPSNLDRIRFEFRKNTFTFFSEFSAKIKISQNILNDVCEYGVESSKLFVEDSNV
ncbi:MAG: hypothetical protein PVH73_00760 [Candidatus Bathyarchaeota archaeon]|jgi:hypothetical protein